MTTPAENNGIDLIYQAVLDLQARAIQGQRQILSRVASRMAETIDQDKRIFVFGTGHSHLMAEEAFYRAGGLSAVVPIFSAALMLHENVELSGRLERTAGLAGPLLDRYQPLPGEMLFIFSNSGVNQMPVEMALQARQYGLFTVSVSSLAYAKKAPLSGIGQRLDEVVDIAIDNCGEPGDALISLPGNPWRVGPGSTILGALIWECLVVACVERLQSLGWDSADLPIFASFNMPGAAEHNLKILARWRKVNPHL